MPDQGMGRIYQPKRKCLHCAGAGCADCGQTGRRQIQTWFVQFSHRNRQYRESSGSTRRADAVAFLKQRVAEVGSGKQQRTSEIERMTFENLMDLLRNDYVINGRKSKVRLETSIDRLTEFFAGARAVDITTERIQLYIRGRIDLGRNVSTIRNETNTLRRALRLAHQCGRVRDVPHFPKLIVDHVRTGFFEETEFRRVLSFLPEPVASIAEFGYWSGWRRGEILALRWSQVDMNREVIRLEVGSTKNNEGRVLPFGVLPALRDLMQRQLALTHAFERDRASIVHHVFHRDGMPVQCFRKVWQAACEQAGCLGKLFHDLRRTAVRNLERAGVPRSTAMKITGHKTESIYRRYAIVNEADIAASLGRLAAFLDRRVGS